MSSTLFTSTNGTDFVANNLHMLGFDNAGNAAVQTIRELVDNSVDACREGQPPGRVTVLVQEVQKDTASSAFAVQVTDNGRGMKDIYSCCRLFSSAASVAAPRANLQSRYSARIGRYGVGLSASIIHSLLKTSIPAEIVSKSSDSESASHAVIAFHPNGLDVELGLQKQQSVNVANPASGTTVRLFLPPLSREELDKVVQDTRSYLSLLCANPFLHLLIDFQVCTAALNLRFSIQSTLQIPLPELNSNHALIAASLNSLLRNHILSLLSLQQGEVGCITQVPLPSTGAHVEAAVAMVEIRPVDSCPPNEPFVPVFVLRWAQGKPVLARSSCALVDMAGATSIWEPFGLCVRPAPPANDKFGSNALQPNFSIAMQDPCSEALRSVQPMALLQIVYYNHPSVNYGDLLKTRLVRLPKQDKRMIQQAWLQCLQQQSEHVSWLQTARERTDAHISRLANAISRISQHLELQDLQQQLFDARPDYYLAYLQSGSDLSATLCTRIQQILARSHRGG